MTKRIQAKNKICRRLGVNLWGRAKDPLAKRDYGPGEHGQKRKKSSDFGTQLAAKQKLKGYYLNITEKQFRRAYATASKLRGDTAENLIGLLERRLDITIFRMNFVPTLPAARQFINHGHVRVNDKRVNIPSYQLREGDEIEVSAKAHHMPLLLEAVQSNERDIPEYLNVDVSKFKGVYVRMPKMADVPYPVRMEPNLVVEYYSR